MSFRNYKPKTKPALWTKMRGGSKPRSFRVRPGVARQKRESNHAKPRKRIRAVSRRQRARSAAYNARVKVWKAENPVCLVCQKHDLEMFDKPRPTEDCHHQRGKLGPLLMDERFWIPVCRPCHAWIDANRNAARAMGLLCQRGEWNKPALL